jgi:hypothetical protein
MKSKFFLALSLVGAIAALALGTLTESARGSQQPAQDSHSSLVGGNASADSALLTGHADAPSLLPIHGQRSDRGGLLNYLIFGSLALGTVLTAPFDAKERKGDIVTVPVKGATHLYPGGLIAINGSGYALPAADTAGLIVIGRNETDADNSGGADGAINTNVSRGIFKYNNSTAHAIAAANVLSTCYVEDDSTVSTNGGTNSIVAGLVIAVDSTGVWVDTRRAV